VRFLADESCDFGIVQALRRAGHDILDVREVAPGAPDADIMTLALQEERILLTEDKDFGQLVYAAGQRSHGVVLFRVPIKSRSWLIENIAGIFERRANEFARAFVVVQPGRIRFSE
jgi:predicted nuclease of predicted toxin-antitoxin system